MIRTEVDGVPTLFAPVSGPLRAGLVFRVGEADEPLPQRGLTHLVEHLALHRHGITDYHFNGATGAVSTSFHVKGSEDEVVGFFGGVCSSLASLPLDRLATEKAILRTEAAGKGRSVFAELAAWRHGARDHGATAYPEYGLHAATEDSTAAWAAHWFTRQNAVLWIAGERLPPGLRLWLREGYRQPVPRPSAVLPPVPSYVTGPCIAYSAHVPESTAAWMFSRFLERQLFRALRQDSGLSYQAAASYTEYGDGSAAIEAGADALAETRDAVLGGFLDVLGRIRAGHIDPADTAAVAAQAIEAYRDPATQAGRLSVAALRLLTGREPVPAEQVVAELSSVTP
ncbi:MAG: zinc protease, partial [Cryptosporangiaceae bacterium]|nr:zinc protease [Cryptosporangiaceae bacterium]